MNNPLRINYTNFFICWLLKIGKTDSFRSKQDKLNQFYVLRRFHLSDKNVTLYWTQNIQIPHRNSLWKIHKQERNKKHNTVEASLTNSRINRMHFENYIDHNTDNPHSSLRKYRSQNSLLWTETQIQYIIKPEIMLQVQKEERKSYAWI